MPFYADIVGLRTRRASPLVIVTLAVLVCGQAFAQAPAGETKSVDRKSLPPAQQDTSKFNTREERLRAKPLDWNSTIGKQEKPAAPHETPRAAPGNTRGGAADPKADSDARRQFPEEWRAAPQPGKRGFLDLIPPENGIQFAGGQPDQFTEFAVTTNAPKPVGKLFSNNGYCSASVVSPNNVIVTAAHCCWNRSTNNWILGWSFVPATVNGSAPYGTFGWASATVLNSWINKGDVASDVCTIRLANNSADQGVAYYTGWLGRSWNFPSDQEITALGYPGNLGGGQVLQGCKAESFSPNNACGGTAILNMGCSMTFGSSGGPWIRGYQNGNWVDSVVHGHPNDPIGQTCTGTFGKTFDGARFTSDNIVAICGPAGC